MNDILSEVKKPMSNEAFEECLYRVQQNGDCEENLRVDRELLLARLEALEAERRWIPVETRLPEQGDIYLVSTDLDSYEICYYGEDGWEGKLLKATEENGLEEDEKITHWQPLPSPPDRAHEVKA